VDGIPEGDGIDLRWACARALALTDHAELSPALPDGRPGTGRITRQGAVALARVLLEAAGPGAEGDLLAEARHRGYTSGYESGWAACLGVRAEGARWRRRNRAGTIGRLLSALGIRVRLHP